MNENETMVDFEDYDVQVDLNQIKNMSKEEIKKCTDKIKEIKEMLNK